MPEKFKRKWGTSGGGDGEYSNPLGIVVFDYEVFIVDQGNFRVQVTDLVGTFKRKWESPAPVPGPFGQPVNAAIYENEIYVTDLINNRAVVFDLNGNFQRQITNAGFPLFVSAPRGIRINNDVVYIASSDYGRISLFDTLGTYLGYIGGSGGTPGKLYGPWGLAIKDDDLFVTDPINIYVHVFSLLDGSFKTRWQSIVPGESSPSRGHGIEIHAEEIWLVDRSHSRVLVFDLQGNYIRLFAKYGTGDGELAAPNDIAWYNGELYVPDTQNHRIQVFGTTKIQYLPIMGIG